jgi:hypothetical protein
VSGRRVRRVPRQVCDSRIWIVGGMEWNIRSVEYQVSGAEIARITNVDIDTLQVVVARSYRLP